MDRKRQRGKQVSERMTPYYEDDEVTLYHGDCREILPSLTFDAIVSDPPYGINWTKGLNRGRGTSRQHDGIANDTDTAARDWVIAAALPRPYAMFGSLYAPFPDPLKQVLIWRKPNDAGLYGSTTGFRRDLEAIFLGGAWPVVKASSSSLLTSTIRNIGSPSSPAGIHGHPHAKPEDLMRTLIERLPGLIILDPFMGSGSTLRAAKDLGRKAIGIEIDERYCEIAAKRLGQEVLF